jgi:hypothetical protein
MVFPHLPILQITRGFATRDLQFGHHACGNFYTLVVPILQIICGFATHDLQFGHHACVKTITSYMEITHYCLVSLMWMKIGSNDITAQVPGVS